jgi:2'-5' RNA ligase
MFDRRAVRENETTMRIAYVILLPDEVHNYMRSVQAELYERYEGNRRTLVLEPHITLKQPFEAAELEPYERYAERLAHELEPLELVMGGFGFFEAEGVVFLEVAQDERLLAIQRAILEDLQLQPAEYESGEPVPYHFHGTVATGLSPDDLADARTRFTDAPEFRFPLDRLGLFRHTRETWTLYKRVRL